MKQLHQIQRGILQKLQFSERLHYSAMKPDQDLENNRFDFHLKQLIKNGLITKSDNYYLLTDEGKKYTAIVDTPKNKVLASAMILVWLVCTRKVHGQRQILMYTRTKHPFFGCQGFPAGKVKMGESIVEAAKSELLQECNLTAEPKLKALLHSTAYSKVGHNLLQDQYMFLCQFDNPAGEIVDSYEGHYQWVPENELLTKLEKPFASLAEYKFALSVLDDTSAKIVYQEHVDYTEDF